MVVGQLLVKNFDFSDLKIRISLVFDAFNLFVPPVGGIGS